jgi:hypothetical protein
MRITERYLGYAEPVGAENSATSRDLGVHRSADVPLSGRQDRALWLFVWCI